MAIFFGIMSRRNTHQTRPSLEHFFMVVLPPNGAAKKTRSFFVADELNKKMKQEILDSVYHTTPHCLFQLSSHPNTLVLQVTS
jgi:hypothetical protein